MTTQKTIARPFAGSVPMFSDFFTLVIFVMRDEGVFRTTHCPILTKSNRWIRSAPYFAQVIQGGDPNQIMLLAIIDHSNGIAITLFENVYRYCWIKLCKHDVLPWHLGETSRYKLRSQHISLGKVLGRAGSRSLLQGNHAPHSNANLIKWHYNEKSMFSKKIKKLRISIPLNHSGNIILQIISFIHANCSCIATRNAYKIFLVSAIFINNYCKFISTTTRNANTFFTTKHIYILINNSHFFLQLRGEVLNFPLISSLLPSVESAPDMIMCRILEYVS